MPSPQQIEAWKLGAIRNARAEALKHDHVMAQVVACKLAGQGCTFDDDLTECRWVIDKLGAVIKRRTRLGVKQNSKHAWASGIRNVCLLV